MEQKTGLFASQFKKDNVFLDNYIRYVFLLNLNEITWHFDIKHVYKYLDVLIILLTEMCTSQS